MREVLGSRLARGETDRRPECHEGHHHRQEQGDASSAPSRHERECSEANVTNWRAVCD